MSRFNHVYKSRQWQRESDCRRLRQLKAQQLDELEERNYRASIDETARRLKRCR